MCFSPVIRINLRFGGGFWGVCVGENGVKRGQKGRFFITFGANSGFSGSICPVNLHTVFKPLIVVRQCFKGILGAILSLSF